jgi:glyoxylase-like metal-dependent hydrolase (beta-lactamase superfamily II)
MEATRRHINASVFWSCYSLGMLLRLPLIVALGIKERAYNAVIFLRTFRRRIDFLQGKLSLCFLSGGPSDLVPLLFGERFVMVFYNGVAFDPGSVRMRHALWQHILRLPSRAVQAIAATHRHEEHTGNLEWLASITGAPVCLSLLTLKMLQPSTRIPFMRRVVIGQPPSIKGPVQVLADRLCVRQGEFFVFPAPGHCADHVVFYDPEEKLLIAGDAFMGAYFSSPNPDVDIVHWMETLERLLQLKIEIMVEGHGHIRTLRSDIREIPGVVLRMDPMEALRQKLEFFRWLHMQIKAGLLEGLPVRAIEASCFPWGHSWAWENFLSDELSRMISGGEFSRSELVRSFFRHPNGKEILPEEYKVQFYKEK